MSAWADKSIDEAGAYDIVLVPGGSGTRREVSNPRILGWVAEASKQADLTLAVCTGGALLAKSGVLDGRRATTNKLAFGWVSEQGPNVRWVHKARWVEDSRFVTSAGVSAGIDMSLGVIASLLGDSTAEQVANAAEYVWNRDRENDPFARASI